jgi:hypothetical protein
MDALYAVLGYVFEAPECAILVADDKDKVDRPAVESQDIERRSAHERIWIDS